MSRSEFSAKTKLERWNHAGGYCEDCGVKIRPGNGPEYDHDIPDGLRKDNSFENCRCLCKTCHKRKTTKEDVPTIAKAKRVGRKHINADRPKQKMPYRKFDGTPVWR